MDKFPSDYKNGALIPIAIILVYPLIGLIRLKFKWKISYLMLINIMIKNQVCDKSSFRRIKYPTN